jgi:hypothetical protein
MQLATEAGGETLVGKIPFKECQTWPNTPPRVHFGNVVCEDGAETFAGQGERDNGLREFRELSRNGEDKFHRQL